MPCFRYLLFAGFSLLLSTTSLAQDQDPSFDATGSEQSDAAPSASDQARSFEQDPSNGTTGEEGLSQEEIAKRQREAEKAAEEACAVCGGGIAMMLILLGVALVLNIALLIWVARDAKNRSMDSSALWMILVMLTGPIGLIIYIFSRPQGQLTQCASCNGKRLSASAKCPHCQNP